MTVQVLKNQTNKVTFIDKNFNIEPMELKSKEAADDILNKVIANFMNKIFTIFLLLSVGFTQAQQLNCTVTVNSETLECNTGFKTLETSLNEFINKTDGMVKH
jgi:hypothetical protein